VLLDTEYWSGLINWLRREPLERGIISATDLEVFAVTDDADEAVAVMLAHQARLDPPRRPE
jgi:hypothetical protein